MMFSFLCLCLSLLAVNVLANEYAGPYQMLLLWNAYRMEIKIYGKGQTYLANGCKGNGPRNSCLFDEFLKYIQRKPGQYSTWVKWKGSTSVGKNLNPDVVATAQELQAMSESDDPSQRYAYNEDWHKLYEDKWAPGARPKFSAAYTDVIHIIQQCREAAPQQSSPVDISDDLARARQAISEGGGGVLDGRQHDSADWLITELNKKIHAKGLNWDVETKPFRAADGSSWEGVDFGKTLEEHPDAPADLKYDIAEFITDWGSKESTNEESQRHYNAIQASKSYQDVLLSDKTCLLPTT